MSCFHGLDLKEKVSRFSPVIVLISLHIGIPELIGSLNVISYLKARISPAREAIAKALFNIPPGLAPDSLSKQACKTSRMP